MVYRYINSQYCSPNGSLCRAGRFAVARRPPNDRHQSKLHPNQRHQPSSVATLAVPKARHYITPGGHRPVALNLRPED